VAAATDDKEEIRNKKFRGKTDRKINLLAHWYGGKGKRE